MAPTSAENPNGILAVFAHPDDETFLAGGTLAKYAATGIPVRVVCATRGEAGQRGRYQNVSRHTFGCMRALEMGAACAALGLSSLRDLGCPDGQVAGACEEAVAAAVYQELEKFSFAIVITFGPDGMSGHPDHVAVHRAVVAAIDRRRELLGSSRVPVLYFVRGSRSLPADCHFKERAPLGVTAEIDISTVGAQKLAAIRRHASQVNLQPRTEQEVALVQSAPEWFLRAGATRVSPRAADDLFSTTSAPRAERRRRTSAARPALHSRRNEP